MADRRNPADDRRIFVSTLNWKTCGITVKDLIEHFSHYGKIESINIETNPNTGYSRGFRTIVYKSPDSLEKLAADDHVIDKIRINEKKEKNQGISQNDEIKTFLDKQGKGSCFITFSSVQVVREILKTAKQTIAGKEVYVKKARPSKGGGYGQEDTRRRGRADSGASASRGYRSDLGLQDYRGYEQDSYGAANYDDDQPFGDNDLVYDDYVYEFGSFDD